MDMLKKMRHKAVQEMGVGPSESACRSRLQTAQAAVVKAMVVSVEEGKGLARRAQFWNRKTSASEQSEEVSKTIGRRQNW